MATVPAGFLSELERRYFWWQPVGGQRRSEDRILAQAMNLADFVDLRRLESVVGAEHLARVLLASEPGWISDRSWELWRGRLSLATGRQLPDEPPRRLFNAAAP